MLARVPRTRGAPGRARTALVAHPSRERYGSDRQCVQSVAALVDAGWRVVVALPAGGTVAADPTAPADPAAGPAGLGADLTAAGAALVEHRAPVLRRSSLSPRGVAALAVRNVLALPALVRAVRRQRPDVVYVSTLTIPLWVVAARLAGVPVVVHVHEAEEDAPAAVRAALVAPLLLARRVLVTSEASRAALRASLSRAARRAVVLPNGVPGPPGGTAAAVPVRERLDGPVRLVLVGRLSPRKGTDVALEAVALLRAGGLDARLTVVGAVFEGCSWFEERLRSRAEQADLAGAVTFAGLAASPWPALAAADVALVPSRLEPFGNAAVEAMLAGRPLVATRAQGLAEVVRDSVDGALVEPGDAAALAAAVVDVVEGWPAARQRAAAAAGTAAERFSVAAYRRRAVELVGEAARGR